MSEASLNKKIAGGSCALAVAALAWAGSWVLDIEKRVAILEDDTDEVVQVIALLHPPQPGVTPTGKAETRQEARRSALEALRQQVAPTPPKNEAKAPDDDDSADDDDSGDDDDSSKAKRPQT